MDARRATLPAMDEPIERLNEDPSRTGIFLDFDGTLSEIVHVPSEARPVEGVKDLLDRLAGKFCVVAVVSGRSAHQLVEWLGPKVEIWGVHGAERTKGGEVVTSEQAAPFVELMRQVHDEAVAAVGGIGIEGILVEDKGVMIGLHFRAASDVAQAREELDKVAQHLADQHGLVRAGGRLAYELRPPVEFSKATVVLERARQERLAAAAFVGDDKVDLPGFDALDVLATEEGLFGVRIGVNSEEAPPELLERADLVVEGPSGVLRLLDRLL